MFTPSHHTAQTVKMQVLTDVQRNDIINSAYTVLETTGFKISKEKARDILKKAGAGIKDDLAYVPRSIVQECLRLAPKGIQIYDRLGKIALNLWGTNVYYGTSTASPNTKDALTGEIHPTRVEDITRGAKLADALPNIDFVMPFGSAQDVDSNVADLYEFEAVVNNTAKPIAFCSYSSKGMEGVFKMAAEVVGGAARLKSRPFIVSYPEPITPMLYPEETIDKMFLSADWGIPQITCAGGQLGATAPVTLAGALVQQVAEAMMSLTLVQLHKPGAPIFFASNFSPFDMKSGLMSMAAPEGNLLSSAMAEVARFFELPSWGLAGATDAKELDAQAGMDSAFSMLSQGMAGINMIHDLGYMDGGMVCSANMLVMGNEAAGSVKQFVGGVNTDPDQLACEVIQKVGAGGNYLQEKHTHKYFKQIWYPELLTRESYNAWQASGSKSLEEKCNDKIRHILETHKPVSLEDKIQEGLNQIKIKIEQEILAG